MIEIELIPQPVVYEILLEGDSVGFFTVESEHDGVIFLRAKASGARIVASCVDSPFDRMMSKIAGFNIAGKKYNILAATQDLTTRLADEINEEYAQARRQEDFS